MLTWPRWNVTFAPSCDFHSLPPDYRPTMPVAQQIHATGAESNSESTISSTPPKPGSQSLESFRPTSRFKSDSARSPIMPAPPTSSPNRSQPHQAAIGHAARVRHAASEMKPSRRGRRIANPPAAPSIVLPGLIKRRHLVPADQAADRIGPRVAQSS